MRGAEIFVESFTQARVRRIWKFTWKRVNCDMSGHKKCPFQHPPEIWENGGTTSRFETMTPPPTNNRAAVKVFKHKPAEQETCFVVRQCRRHTQLRCPKDMFLPNCRIASSSCLLQQPVGGQCITETRDGHDQNKLNWVEISETNLQWVSRCVQPTYCVCHFNIEKLNKRQGGNGRR